MQKKSRHMRCNNRAIQNKSRTLKTLKTHQNGGETEEHLLNRMREYRDAGGKFVLILGASLREKHCIDFQRSKYCEGKMLISIDSCDAENNFNLDFNYNATWRKLDEFRTHFHTVIFDYSVDKFIDPTEVDIISEIKNLLMVGGKLYKYFSRGTMTIPPGGIAGDHVGRELNESDKEIIRSQFNIEIPTESMDKINKITHINFYRTQYGFIEPEMEDMYTMPDDEYKMHQGRKGLTYWSLRPRIMPDSANHNLNYYINSLYAYYKIFTYSELLIKYYKFKIKLVKTCSHYPLKNPNRPAVRYANDKCYVICTKGKK